MKKLILISAMLAMAWVVEGAPDLGGFAIFVPATAFSLWLAYRVYAATLPEPAPYGSRRSSAIRPVASS